MKKIFILAFLAFLFSASSYAVVGPITGTRVVCAGGTTTLADTSIGGVWSSVGTLIAVVNPTSGVVTGISSGTALISYTKSGAAAIAVVTVNPTPAAIGGASAVCVGATLPLSDATIGGTWTTSNTSIAIINPTSGVATGVSAGSATISYTLTTGCFTTKVISVKANPAAITGSSSVCVGGTTSLSDATTGGTWTSSNSSIIVNPTTGVITGVSSGSAIISYILTSGCYVTTFVTTSSGPAAIGGPSTVCVGSTITLTDATSGGTWLSSNIALATVNPATGIVTGVSLGTATITYKLTSGCYTTKTVSVIGLSTPISGPSLVCVGSNIALTDATTGGTWLSGSTTIAKVSSTGIVTGLSNGVVNIYYTVGGCGASHTVTVAGGASISGPSSVCAGSTITLSDASPGGSWTGGGTVASVSSAGVVTGLIAGVTNIYYIISGCPAYHTVTVTPGLPASTGASTVCVGATTLYSNSISGGTWSSSNIGVALVNLTTGVVSGGSLGTATITYSTPGGCFTTKVITVTTLTTPVTGGSVTCVGSTISLADATPGGTWSSGTTLVAKVNPTTGVVTGVAAGTVNIYYYASGGCSAYKTVTIVTAPKSITGPSTACLGGTISLSDSTGGGSWLSSNTALATVSSTGVVTGANYGVLNIYYIVGSCSAYHTVTVMPAPAAITGPSDGCVGISMSLADATTGGTWTSSTPAIASVGVITGVVTAVSVGVTTISYTVGGCSATRSFTVDITPKPISGPSTVCSGATIALSDSVSGGLWYSGYSPVASVSSGGIVSGVSAGTASINYIIGACVASKVITVVAGASPISGMSGACVGLTIPLSDATPGGTWNSSSPSTVSVGISTGLATAVSAGIATITYTTPGGCSATYTITVNTTPKPISGPSGVCVGSTITAVDSVSGGVWMSSNMSVATIGATSGVITGMAPGTTTIYYTFGACVVSKIITVSGPSAISGPSVICAGATLNLSDAVSGGAWTSSSTVIATVSSIGVVTGASAGVATISYSISGCVATHAVTVNAAPGPIGGASSVNVSATIALSDATSGGAWLSSNMSLATVSSTGVVTGVATGILNIYYIVGACAAYHTVTVTPKAPGTISGKIITGGAKGTSSEAPVSGMNVALRDNSGNTITMATTGDDGTYSFDGLDNADYIVYPQEGDYSTVASPLVSISVTTPVVSGINFRQNTTAKTIAPVTTAVAVIMANDADMSIFPNPASGNLNIRWSGQATGAATISITDVVGHEVLSSPLNINEASGQVQLPLTGIKNGIYIITIRSATVNYSGRLMVQQ